MPSYLSWYSLPRQVVLRCGDWRPFGHQKILQCGWSQQQSLYAEAGPPQAVQHKNQCVSKVKHSLEQFEQQLNTSEALCSIYTILEYCVELRGCVAVVIYGPTERDSVEYVLY